MRGLKGLIGVAVAGMSIVVAQPAAAAVQGELVRERSTAAWSTPSSDPTGLTYNGKRFLISDSEVDENSLWRGRNLFVARKKGTLRKARRLDKATLEPEDIAWWRRKRILFVADDDLDAIFRIRRGRDGRIGTRDDKVRKILNTRAFGSFDPEGLEWNGRRKMLIWTDATDLNVYKVRRGRDGRFGTRDDRMGRFDTGAFGFTDPEGVALDKASRHLFIVSSRQKFVVETTKRGQLVQTIALPFCGANCNLSGLVFAPGSDGSKKRLYLIDRGRDNDLFPDPADHNDGKFYEVRLVTVPDPPPPEPTP